MEKRAKILERLIAISESLFFRPEGLKDPKNSIPISIFATIIDSSNDILLLYKNRRLISAIALLRGVIDSLYDLIALKEDINNANYLFYVDIKNSIKLLEPKLNPAMPDYVSDQKIQRDIISQLKELKYQLKQLESEGYSSSSHKDKFTRVNADYFHRTIFQYFNSEVHNSLSAIEKRHFKIKSDGNFEIRYMQEYSEDEYPIFTYLGISLLVAFTKTSQILEWNRESEITEMIDLLNKEITHKQIDIKELMQQKLA